LEEDRYFELTRSLLGTQLRARGHSESHKKALEIANRLLTTGVYLPEERLEALKEVTQNDLRTFKADLVRQNVRALAFGNLEQKKASLLAVQVKAQSSSTSQPAYLGREGSYVFQTSGGLTAHTVLNRYEMGLSTPQRLAAAVMLDILLQNQVFDELRNKQQLGYYATAFLDTRFHHLALEVLVQGAELSPPEMDARISAFLKDFNDQLWFMDEAVLSNVANSASGLLLSPQTFAERRNCLWPHVVSADFQFSELAQAATALPQVTKADLVQALESLLQDTEVLSVQVFAGAVEFSERQAVALDYFQTSSLV